MWTTLIACVYWEPMVFDGWSLRIIQLQAPTTSWANVVAFAKNTYLHGNPRLGQVFSMLLYTVGPWHVIVTPLVLLGLFWLATTVALGRWPALRRTDDALAFLTVSALIIATSPHVGPVLFHRPITGNYTFPVALDLALLVPYRFHLERPRHYGLITTAVLFIIGVSAGLCNEHTGPAIGALLAAVLVWSWRRDHRVEPWVVVGLIAFSAGYLALMFAPGQHVRYGGLADQQTIIERILDRGFIANLLIVGQFLLHVLALLGERLYIASTVMISVGFAPWLLARTGGGTFLRWRTALGGLILVMVGWRCLVVYHELGPASVAREKTILAAPPHTSVTVDRFPRGESWWNLADDLADLGRREYLAHRLGLQGLDIR